MSVCQGSRWAIALLLSLGLTTAAPAQISVTSNADSGTGTLRAAILEANAAPGSDDIVFDLGGSTTITLTSSLPTIDGRLFIDGFTQASGSDPVVEVRGDGTFPGLTIDGSNVLIFGLIIRNFTTGVRVVSGDEVVIGATGTGQRNVISGNNLGIAMSGRGSISGNYIGTDIQGATADGNSGSGIEANSGDVSISGNVIAANGGAGILLTGSGDANGYVVRDNHIGTSAAGDTHIPNGDFGIWVDGVTPGLGVLIGGDAESDRNVIAGHAVAAVYLSNGTDEVTVAGNFIGTDASGTVDLGDGIGIWIENSTGNTIGGSTAAEGNLISGNTVGLSIGEGGNNNRVVRNFIGTDSAESDTLGNSSHGVRVAGTGNEIGGDATGNVIAGNGGAGALIAGSGNTLRGNWIGTDQGRVAEWGNVLAGISIEGSDNAIGGGSGEGNFILNNGGDGVEVLGATSSGNLIRGNSIEANGGIGIDLDPTDGVTPNDPLDSDTGPNGLQNYPVITAAWAATTIRGELESAAGAEYEVEFFWSPTCDGSAHGEGASSLGSMNVTTDESGEATFEFSSAVVLDVGSAITATATDASNNTSEFSECATLADFSLTPSENSITVGRGVNETIDIAVASTGGDYGGEVELVCSATPPLSQCIFDPAARVVGTEGWTSSLTLVTGAPLPGEYFLTVQGQSAGGNRHDVRIPVTVLAGELLFQLEATPVEQTVARGKSTIYLVTVTSEDPAFGDEVTLTCDDTTQPQGVGCAFEPPTVIPNTEGVVSVATVTVDAAATLGSDDLTFQGTSGATEFDYTVALVVLPSTALNVNLSPNRRAVPVGASADYAVSVAVQGTDPVALSCSSLPEGAACEFSSPAVIPGTEAELTVSTTESVSGRHVIEVAAASAAGTDRGFAVLTLEDYAIDITPGIDTTSSRRPAEYTVRVDPDSRGGSFGSEVSFTCADLPAGTTCAFDPPTVTPNNDTGMTILTVSLASGSVVNSASPIGADRLPAVDPKLALALFTLVAGLALALRPRHRSGAREPRRSLIVAAVLVVMLPAMFTACDCETCVTGPERSETVQFTVVAEGGGLERTAETLMTVIE